MDYLHRRGPYRDPAAAVRLPEGGAGAHGPA